MNQLAAVGGKGAKYQLGKKNYELTNHLGNVNAVITDRKLVNTDYVVNTFTNSTNSWGACGNATLAAGGNSMTVTSTGPSNNCTYKLFATTVNVPYIVRIKSDKGTVTAGLRVSIYGGATLIKQVALSQDDFSTVSFIANGANTTIIIEPISGNGNYKIDEVSITSNSIYEAVVVMKADYYPFGMQMPGRNLTSDNYRFGYNGMEKDIEMKGDGNSYTTEFRQYDPRLGRWSSLDPLMMIFPWQSPYCAFDNNPVLLTDPTGLATEGWGGKKDENGTITYVYDEKLNSIEDAKAAGYDYYKADGSWTEHATVNGGSQKGTVNVDANGDVHFYSDEYDPVIIGKRDPLVQMATDVATAPAEEDNSIMSQLWGDGQKTNMWQVHPDVSKMYEGVWKNMNAIDNIAKVYLTVVFCAPAAGATSMSLCGGGASLTSEMELLNMGWQAYKTKFVSGTLCWALNNATQLSLNGGKIDELDQVSAVCSFAGPFIPANPFASAAWESYIDAEFDYSVNKGMQSPILGNKTAGKVANDFFWNVLGNMGAASFGDVKPQFEIFSESVTNMPTNVINNNTNKYLFPDE